MSLPLSSSSLVSSTLPEREAPSTTGTMAELAQPGRIIELGGRA